MAGLNSGAVKAERIQRALGPAAGMNCSAELWSRLDRGGWPPLITADLTESTLQGQVSRLLDELPRRFAIGGPALGGIVAMALTRTAPERISSLILLSTNPYAPASAQRNDWRAWRRRPQCWPAARELQLEWLPQLLSSRHAVEAIWSRSRSTWPRRSARCTSTPSWPCKQRASTSAGP